MIYPRLLTGFGMLIFLSLTFYGISGQIFGLISSFLSNRRLRVVLDGNSSQEYPVNAGDPRASILGPTLFLLYIIELLMLSVILLSMLIILLFTLNVIRIWSMATTRIGFWHCGLGQDVACRFQCWKNSTGFIWPA